MARIVEHLPIEELEARYRAARDVAEARDGQAWRAMVRGRAHGPGRRASADRGAGSALPGGTGRGRGAALSGDLVAGAGADGAGGGRGGGPRGAGGGGGGAGR